MVTSPLVTPSREEVEARVRELCARGDYARATSEALRAYGGEVLGFLTATHRSEQEADEVFADFAEGVWRSLPRFAWDASLRTWAYAIARNISLTFRRDAGRRARRGQLVGESQLADVVQAARSDTASYISSSKRTKREAMYAELGPDDRMLLVLRLERQLAWNDLAVVMAKEAHEALDAAAMTKEAARLRKRYQLIKERLRRTAQKEGLVPRTRK